VTTVTSQAILIIDIIFLFGDICHRLSPQKYLPSLSMGLCSAEVPEVLIRDLVHAGKVQSQCFLHKRYLTNQIDEKDK